MLGVVFDPERRLWSLGPFADVLQLDVAELVIHVRDAVLRVGLDPLRVPA